jgi:hypothetical protein
MLASAKLGFSHQHLAVCYWLAASGTEKMALGMALRLVSLYQLLSLLMQATLLFQVCDVFRFVLVSLFAGYVYVFLHFVFYRLRQ